MKAFARSYGGTGLGMSIVKQLVELMNGVRALYKVKKAKARGLNITLCVSQRRRKRSSQKRPNSHVEAHILADKKILLVEDNEMNRVVAETILNQYGASIF